MDGWFIIPQEYKDKIGRVGNILPCNGPMTTTHSKLFIGSCYKYFRIIESVIYYILIQTFLNHVIIMKTKLLLPQA